MSQESQKKNTPNAKTEDGRFRSKNIKHDPNAESARAVFGLNQTTDRKGAQ